MALSDQELADLKERCNFAHSHGFQIGLAEHIVADLEDEGGEAKLEAGVSPNSPAHLLALICMVEETRNKSSAKRTVSKSKKAPKEEAPAAAPPPAAEPPAAAPPAAEPSSAAAPPADGEPPAQ